MKYLYKYIFVLSLFVFSTQLHCCFKPMHDDFHIRPSDLGLTPYQPNTLKNIKKERINFIKFLAIGPYDSENEPLRLMMMKNSLSAGPGCDFRPDLFRGHSVHSSIIMNLNLNFTYKAKIDLMKGIIVEQDRSLTARDIQFLQLMSYEKMQKNIFTWFKGLSYIETMIDQPFPEEIMRHVGMLMINTEESFAELLEIQHTQFNKDTNYKIYQNRGK